MMPLFVYEDQQQSFSLDGRTRIYFGSFIVGGLGLSIYSAVQLVGSFSYLYVCSLLTGFCVCGGYAWLWSYLQRSSFHPSLVEVHPTHLFLKRYNYPSQKYVEFTFAINQIHIIIEKHLEPCQGVMYLVPALHLYDPETQHSMQLVMDRQSAMNEFLTAIRKANGVIRFLPYSLDYCTQKERLEAFQEADAISFSGELSDYVPSNQEAFFYEELITYKDLLIKRKTYN